MRTGKGRCLACAAAGFRILLSVGLVVALVGGSLRPPQGVLPSAGAGWAIEAEKWVDAWHAAGSEGQWNRLSFMAGDVIFEDRVGGRGICGPEDVIHFSVASWGPSDHAQPLRTFLSAEAVMDQTLWGHAGYEDWLDRLEMDGSTVARIVNGASLRTGGGVDNRPLDFDGIDDLADRYLQFWNGADPAAGRELYSPGASIEDSLLGRWLRGADQITGSVGSDAWPDFAPATIVTLVAEAKTDGSPPPHPRGPAIYITPPKPEQSGPVEVRIVLEADAGSGCPGAMVAELGWDGERILWERRYHDIASTRRCLDPDDLRPGWWEGITVPDPVRIQESAPMLWAERGVTVRIVNGTPTANRFVRWGLERFAAADLPPPRVDSVTFLSSTSICHGRHGFLQGAGDEAAITLCYAADTVCVDDACSTWSPPAQHTLLHELAHAWMKEHLSEQDEQAFLALEGLDQWSDFTDPWPERGMERAAEVIAFALSDNPATACAPGSPDPQHLEGFRLITGREPPATCP